MVCSESSICISWSERFVFNHPKHLIIGRIGTKFHWQRQWLVIHSGNSLVAWCYKRSTWKEKKRSIISAASTDMWPEYESSVNETPIKPDTSILNKSGWERRAIKTFSWSELFSAKLKSRTDNNCIRSRAWWNNISLERDRRWFQLEWCRRSLNVSTWFLDILWYFTSNGKLIFVLGAICICNCHTE